MFKKFLFLLILCISAKILLAENLEINNSITSNLNEVQNVVEIETKSAGEELGFFSVKKSTEFNKYAEHLTTESKAELEAFIKKIEQTLLRNIEFGELIKQYKNLFEQLKDVKKESPKVELIFLVDGENLVDLFESKELNIDALKNSLSEKQLIKIKDDLKAMSISLECITKSALAGLENSNLQKELKEKSGNKIFSVGIIFA